MDKGMIKGVEPVIMPTVGRIVYYKLYNGEVRPATIVRVYSEDTVNIVVDLDGRNDVFNGFSEEECDNCRAWRGTVLKGEYSCQWDWMPYQKGQAANTEALEREFDCKPGQEFTIGHDIHLKKPTEDHRTAEEYAKMMQVEGDDKSKEVPSL